METSPTMVEAGLGQGRKDEWNLVRNKNEGRLGFPSIPLLRHEGKLKGKKCKR